MILTVCPNPCIDCTLEVGEFRVGRLNRIENIIENMSGKAHNTAIGVKRLGGEVFATGFMFESGGKKFARYLTANGIDNEFVWNKGRIRTNYKIIDDKSMMTEINDRGEYVDEKKQKELLETVRRYAEKADLVVISGSLPSGVDDRYYYDLVKAAGNTPVAVDAENGRLKAALSAGVRLVKPNISELEEYYGEHFDTFDKMVVGAKKIIDEGAEFVMLSLGAEGAIFTDGKESHYCKSENVAVNSTVGAGDSMVAAACLAMLAKLPMSEVLRRAVAAATASVTTAGTNLFAKEKYYEILEKLSVIKL